MYLKNLEILGFKSFAEKTKLDFDKGITAVVGPNGCGKTNIVDSIRWSIGEQSAKSLRSSKMEDVIFHGTDDRKGTGMAEVALTFDNSDKKLPVDFEEVTISRRVFRSGESQYFINKNLCRLKDIDALFVDTGVGMRAYSVFEQGKMDLILSSKPEERRSVFEEAAGISKYKEKKREALNKLESTENNLVRLNDIIKEVQRQLNSIDRQAAKARRYKKLKDEFQEMEVKLLVHDLRELSAKYMQLEKDKQSTEQQVAEIRSSINEKEAYHKELRQLVSQMDNDLTVLQDEKFAIEARLIETKHEIQNKRNKIKEIKEREIIIDHETERISKELESLSASIENILAECAVVSNSKKSFKDELETKLEIVRAYEEEYNELTKGVSLKKDLIVGKTARESQLKNEISNIDFELKSLVLKHRRDTTELNRKKQQQEELSQELSKMESVLNIQKDALLVLRQKIKDHEEKMIVLKEEVIKINQLLRDKQQYFSEKRSEYELLSSQKKDLEGCAEGVKVVLEKKDVYPGVIGLVDDIISVPKEYVSAISSVLGAKMQWIVVDTLENAYRAAERLHSDNVSQTVFIALDSIPQVKEIAETKSEQVEQTENITFASNSQSDNILAEFMINLPVSIVSEQNADNRIKAIDIVGFDTKYENLVNFLLGGVCIVKGLSEISAQHLSSAVSVSVTQEGIVVDSSCVVYGGKISGTQMNLIARDTSINELKEVLNSLSTEILELKEKNNAAQSMLTQEERQLESSKHNLYNEEIAFSVQENDFMRHKTLFESMGDEVKVMEADGMEEDSLKIEYEADKSKKESEMQSLVGEIAMLYSEVEKDSASLQDIQKQKEKAETEYTEIKIALVGIEEKENLYAFKKTEIQRQLDSGKASIEKLSKEKIDNSVFADRISEEAVQLEEGINGLVQQSAEMTGKVDALRSRRRDTETALNDGEENLRKERALTDNIYAQLNERQMQLSEMKLKTDSITQRLQGDYKMSQEAIDGVSLEGVSIEAFEQEILTLRDKLDSMGEVSLMAIEEQDELVKRNEFLTVQRQDLISSKDILLKTITKLNSTSKQMFWEAFCKIRENFVETFCKLFGGGKADLVLIDENDILESGIEIIARPPGKKLQNVSLLSGGEKALTALALLFSIFKVKPSPFCILDEIDAPLDDSNVGRFVQLLKEFSQLSQFIVVTHNKRTISAAQTLYGVTMQESGVSRVVSVKMKQEAAVV